MNENHLELQAFDADDADAYNANAYNADADADANADADADGDPAAHNGDEKLVNGSVADFDIIAAQEEQEYSLERKDAKYPADCYSFLSLHGPLEQPRFFAFGMVVWLFQVTFLFLMVLKVAGGKKLSENEDMDNPDNTFLSYFVPSNVSTLSRVTQFMALLSYSFFADDSLKDVVKAVEMFPNFKSRQAGDKINCMLFSCMLRFFQGVLATLVVLLLVINTQDVVEIILNFTAVNFISGFDDIAFELAQWGKYGPRLKAEANRIEDLTVPNCVYRKYDHVRYQCTILPVALVLIILATSIAIGQESHHIWLTQILRVQFQDGSVFEDYSGCYELDTNSTTRSRKRENYVGFQKNAESARFGYCQNTRKWILHKGNSTDACDFEEMIAYSTKTYYFDISMSFEDIWYSSSGRPLQLYFFDDVADLDEGQCSSFIGDGICNPDFNLADNDFDEGDCCAATCTDTLCGVDTLTEVFGTTIVSGNGYPDCIDPIMKPITIRLNNVFHPTSTAPSPQFSMTVNRQTKEPLMILDCDGKNAMMVSVNEEMMNKTQTVMVADGANCMMMTKNKTIGDDFDIWYVDYTIFHGDEASIEANPIVMTQGNSFEASVTYFQRIEDCFLEKLEDYIEKATVYTGTDPSTQAIRWLMKDSRYSSCERSDFLERYALTAINFAAPAHTEGSTNEEMTRNENDHGLWITTGRHCIWRAVGCTGSTVTELNYNALGDRFISGTMATEIGLLTNLAAISLDSCNLSGSIPSEVGLLTALTLLGIYNNTLDGSIPTEIGALKKLNSLAVSENSLAGSIPSEIGLATSLTMIGVYSNRLDSTIPSEIGDLSSLMNLVLDNNRLIGTIPTQLGNLNDLNYFGMGFNSISGEIPSELGKIESLEHIVFDFNNLVGSVPKELLDMDLISLGVYGNKLSNLTTIEDSVICFASGGEHYCDCSNNCVKDPIEPDRCACAAGKVCCEEFLTQFEECIMCDDGMEEPNKFVHVVKATCSDFSRFVTKSVKQFGTEEACNEVALYGEAVGCRCKGGSRYTECVVCEFGIENSDYFVEELGLTCSDASEYVRRDILSYGTETQCNNVRKNATALGCRCKDDTSEEESDLGEGPHIEEYTECIICEFGFENPDYFVVEITARCIDAAAHMRREVEAYGTKTACDDSRFGLLELGCTCKDGDMGLEEYIECNVCKFGLDNPDFFVDKFQASCGDTAVLILENIEAYGRKSVCDSTSIELAELGCQCKNDESNFELTGN